MITAGTTVNGGYYLNRDAWDLVAINGKEGVLPGADGQRYLKLPVWAVLVLAPLLGSMFVMFLPMIGFVLVFMHLGRLSWSLVARLRRPDEVHSAGKGDKTDGPADEPDAEAKNKAGEQ
jgi:hypothetical protein